MSIFDVLFHAMNFRYGNWGTSRPSLSFIDEPGMHCDLSYYMSEWYWTYVLGAYLSFLALLPASIRKLLASRM